MIVADGLEMLEISATVMGELRIIHPTLIWDNDTVILVDTGYPGQLPLIREAMEKAGVPFNKLSHVVITHQDMDHIGSLAAIVKATPQKPEVLSHEEEKPFIQGERKPIKLNQLKTSLNPLSEEQQNFYETMKANYMKFRANVDQTLTDGEELPYCGGITVIHTPGHTLGHICLYLKQSKTLITGDALFGAGRLLAHAPVHFNFDNALAIKSLKKLTQYDIETVICYHGGLYQDNPNRRIAELATV